MFAQAIAARLIRALYGHINCPDCNLNIRSEFLGGIMMDLLERKLELEEELKKARQEYKRAVDYFRSYTQEADNLFENVYPVFDTPERRAACREAEMKADEWLEITKSSETRIELATKELESVNQQIEILYEHPDIPEKLIVTLEEFNQELLRYLAKHPKEIYNLHSRKFEQLVARILKDFGFDVELTPATRDGGRDILAYLTNNICTFLTFVECKRYAPHRLVGIETVQRLYGVQQSYQANKSLIVTTSDFSKPARDERLRYEYQMELKNYNDLKQWLEPYK
jgi:HJR/Mrr/RecB family endonuclease